MDYIANSAEDLLIDSFQFKITPGASYVTDRRSVSYFTAGSNIYQSGSGTRVIRLNISGDGWLDPSTIRLHYTLVNNDGTAAHRLRPISGPWSFFRRVRCLVGGALVDDIDYYNRVHEMLHICTSTNNRDNDDVESWGYKWDAPGSWNPTAGNDLLTALPGIAGGSSVNVCFKPLCGLFSQSKFIPLQWCPLTLELEIVSTATDAVVETIGGGIFDNTNTSVNWSIQDIRVIGDVITLDSGLQNSYAQHVLGGGALPINYSTYISILQAVVPPTINVSVTRAVSRLKSVFFNFDINHAAVTGTRVADALTCVLNDFNSFMHPMIMNSQLGGVAGAGTAYATYDSSREIEWQIQIASKMFPEYPCRSQAQSFYELRKALGIASSPFHSISITPRQYINDHFICAVDTEKIIEAGFTGLKQQGTRSSEHQD